jgi:hypothetical protein
VTSWLRASLFSVFGLLWLTGAVWLLLHWFFQVQTEFGTGPHPLQPGILIAHGLLGVVAVFLFGWMCGTHVASGWKRRVKRGSGISLIAALGLLTLTGFGTYYVTFELVMHANAWAHEVMGLAAVLPALLHWLPALRAPKS